MYVYFGVPVRAELEAILAQGELCMKAYDVLLRVRRAPPLPPARVVRATLTGFESQRHGADILRTRDGVIRNRLTAKKRQGGPIERIETFEDEEGVPYAMVTFESAAGRLSPLP